MKIITTKQKTKLKIYSFDKFREECGVFGIHNNSDAAAITALGLHALQHRGQEAAGIVTKNNQQFHLEKRIGLVGDNFSKKSVIDKLPGNCAIGHNRYSTTGAPMLRNVQPLYADLSFGGLTICHNGNLTNAQQLKENLVKDGSIFHTTSDTEVMIHLLAKSKKSNFIDKLVEALSKVVGAYSFLIMTKDLMIGVRDPNGVRPLVIGELKKESKVLASETVALDIVDAKFIREVKPGEIVVLSNKNELKSIFPFEKKEKKFCIFEYIYFSRPDTTHEDQSVYEIRKAIGQELARETGVAADYVCAVPDSGNAAALGYSLYSKIPFELGVIRNHYVGRTFIEPSEKIRHLGVKLKHNANKKYLKNKKIILVDDSIVRGTTSKKIVEMVRNAGAKEVHFRVASPPTIGSCFYGVNTPTKKELIANNKSIEKIRKFIGADSLSFISIEGLYKALGRGKNKQKFNHGYCDACFTGKYPIKLVDQIKNNNINQTFGLSKKSN